MSQSGGWEGRGSHVKWPHCRPPRGKREHSISSFQHISLWRGERRHAVQGKQCGSWRGGPHVVCVSGRLDLEGFTPSGSQSLLSQKSQSRPWRPPCAGSLGSHVVLGTAHNDIPGPAGHGSLSLETLSPRGAGLAKYQHGLASWRTCHVGPTSPPRSSSCSPFGPGQRFLSLTSLSVCLPSGLPQDLLTGRCWDPGIQPCKERMNE